VGVRVRRRWVHGLSLTLDDRDLVGAVLVDCGSWPRPDCPGDPAEVLETALADDNGRRVEVDLASDAVQDALLEAAGGAA